MQRPPITLRHIIFAGLSGCLLSGMAYYALIPHRESARQHQCAVHLREIHQAMAMYAADWPSDLPTLAQYDLAPMPGANLRSIYSAYGLKEAHRHCPTTPASIKENLFSTYQSPLFVGDSPDSLTAIDLTISNLISVYDSKAPLLLCSVHDEFYYRAIDGTAAKERSPYLIWIDISGAFHSERCKSYPRALTFLPLMNKDKSKQEN